MYSNRKDGDNLSNFSWIFSFQVIALTVKNVHQMDAGIVFAFSTIVIPPLTGITNEYNRNEFLKISGEQASWIGE